MVTEVVETVNIDPSKIIRSEEVLVLGSGAETYCITFTAQVGGRRFRHLGSRYDDKRRLFSSLDSLRRHNPGGNFVFSSTDVDWRESSSGLVATNERLTIWEEVICPDGGKYG